MPFAVWLINKVWLLV